MTERSWYQVDRIISEKYERRGTRLEKFYEVSWVPTWERAKRIKEQVPVIVEAYEKKKRSSARINCESESVETKPEVLVPQKKVRIVGVADDDGKDIKSATMVLRNNNSGKYYCMKYEEIKKKYAVELIEFFEDCIIGFTDN